MKTIYILFAKTKQNKNFAANIGSLNWLMYVTVQFFKNSLQHSNCNLNDEKDYWVLLCQECVVLEKN